MNIHQVLCWFRVAEHSFVRRKIGFQLQSSSSSSQLPQCCPVVQCDSHCSHFSPTLFILLPRTVYWSGRSWFSVCVCVCVCDACMFLLHCLFCCPELCTDLAEVGSVCVWCLHVFAAWFILLPRIVDWSGRSWFCVCVMCACFCCTVYFAAQNSVLIWQKLVLCDVCMFLLHGLFCCPEQCTDLAEVGFLCVMYACFCCSVYFAAQNCVLIWQKLVLCVCVMCACFCCTNIL